MKKINSVIYNKLLAQAEEAKAQGLTSLAAGILEAIGPHPNEEREEYAYRDLKEEIQRDMWKMATRVMYYYDIESLDAQKMNETISAWASKMLGEFEETMNVSDVTVGPLEPKVPGQDK